MYTRPLRRTTRQCSHIRLTLARTFIVSFLPTGELCNIRSLVEVWQGEFVPGAQAFASWGHPMQLTRERLEMILQNLPGLTIGLLGDLFLDRYLEIDPELEERSIETGRPAHQVVRIRNSPGALGTIMNNLAALGVGRIVPVTVIGDDGHAYDLLRAMDGLPVDTTRILRLADRMTPTYTKPIELRTGQPPYELNRLDVRSRHPLSETAQQMLTSSLQTAFAECDGWIVLDQVPEEANGVVNPRTRQVLEQLCHWMPDKLVLVDSRERLGCFRVGMAKGNRREFLQATGRNEMSSRQQLWESVTARVHCTQQPAFCTLGEEGILVALPDTQPVKVHAVPVTGPIDIVGAGDAASSAIVSGLLAGASPWEAAAFANLVASITIEQLGTTGVAHPDEIRRRFLEKGAPCVTRWLID